MKANPVRRLKAILSKTGQLFSSTKLNLPFPGADVSFRHAVVCELCGGVANQIICYKLGRYIAEIQERTLILDASWYAEQPADTNRNLQIVNFNLRFDAITYSKSWVQSLLERHQTIRISGYEFQKFEESSTKDLAEERIHLDGQLIHCDLWGGLTLRETADRFATENYLHEFSIDPHRDFCDADVKARKLILAAENPVAVHVRRGDFATHDDSLLLTESFFNRAIAQLERALPGVVFFIFSDDIPWCRERLRATKEIHFMDFNDERHAYRDLALAASCRHFVLSHRSTFSHQMVELNPWYEGRVVIRSTDADFERRY